MLQNLHTYLPKFYVLIWKEFVKILVLKLVLKKLVPRLNQDLAAHLIKP